MTKDQIYEQAINDFWKYRKTQTISANETRMYFYLLHQAYLNNWKQPICATYSEINAFRLSQKKLEQTLKSLFQKNMIEFTNKESEATLYYIVNKHLL